MASRKDWISRLAMVLLMCLSAQAWAETRFITDVFEVTVRSGRGTGFSIIRLLNSGTPVELLELDPDSGYSRVRLDDGTEGWVITRYLMDQPSARDRLSKEVSRSAALNAQFRATREQLQQTESELETTRQQLAAVTSDRDELATALDDLRRETADTIAIARSNRELQKQRALMSRELEKMRAQNAELADRAAQQWFLLGGAVLLVGILFGILVTRIRWHRRRRWEDL